MSYIIKADNSEEELLFSKKEQSTLMSILNSFYSYQDYKTIKKFQKYKIID